LMLAKRLVCCLLFGLLPGVLWGQSRVTSIRKQAPEPSAGASEIEQAIQRLGDPHFRIREEATQRLVDIGKSAVPALVEAGESQDLEVRRRAERIIASIRNSPQFWMEGLRDPRPSLRVEAANALGRIGASARRATPLLLESLKDKNHAVKEA